MDNLYILLLVIYIRVWYIALMKVITISQLRQTLQDVVDSIYYTNEPVVVIRRNKPRVMINPLPEGDKNVDFAIKEYEKHTSKLSGLLNNKNKSS